MLTYKYRIKDSNSRTILTRMAGTVNFAKTKMAKSVLDASWSMAKTFFGYKSIKLGKVFTEVAEAWTSRTCSDCGAIGNHQGLSGLSVREWICSNCGTLHDRDTNAALNILRIGHNTLLKESPDFNPGRMSSILIFRIE